MAGIRAASDGNCKAFNPLNSHKEDSKVKSTGQLGGRSCKWLRGPFSVEEKLKELTGLNTIEKKKFQDIGSLGAYERIRAEESQGIILRLCVWAEEKFGAFLPFLRGYKEKYEKSSCNEILYSIDNYIDVYIKLNDARIEYKDISNINPVHPRKALASLDRDQESLMCKLNGAFANFNKHIGILATNITKVNLKKGGLEKAKQHIRRLNEALGGQVGNIKEYIGGLKGLLAERERRVGCENKEKLERETVGSQELPKGSAPDEID